MTRIDGTNFGCPFLGVYDYPFKFLANLITRAQAQSTPGLVNVLTSNQVSDAIMTFFLNISSKSEVTPQGFINILEVVFESLQAGYTDMTTKIFKTCLKMLCSFLREDQLLSIQEWPEKCGGGLDPTCKITSLILKIFCFPYLQTSMEKDQEAISSELAKSDIIYLTLNALRYIPKE